MEQTCIKCLKPKPAEQFHWQNKSKGKRLTTCKPCNKARDILLHKGASRPKHWNKK